METVSLLDALYPAGGSAGIPASVPKVNNAADFINTYGGAAEVAGKALGVDPKILLGQWGLETGWGKSIIPGTNNLGNIKDFSGAGTAATDNMTGSRDKYRTYASPADFANDYVSLIQRKYPGALGVGSDAARFAAGLKGYAEDPQYANKLARASRMASNAPGPVMNALGKAVSSFIPSANAKPMQQPTQRAPMALNEDIPPELAGLVNNYRQQPEQQALPSTDPLDQLVTQFKQQPVAPKQAKQGAAQAAHAEGSTGDSLLSTAIAATPAGFLANLVTNPGGMERRALMGLASGFADVGNTIINSGTKAGANAMPTNPDAQWMVPQNLRQPERGVFSLVTGQQPMSQAQRDNADRAAGLQQFNTDNASLPFAVGRIGGNVLATAPVGGLIGGAVKGAGTLPGLTQFAPALTAAGEAISTGGMSTGLAPTSAVGTIGNLSLRSAGGAINGGATAALIDPESAKVGAAVGAALPPTVAAVGKIGSLAAAGIRSLRTPDEVRAAKAILEAGGLTNPQDIAAVRAAVGQMGPNIVAEGPTVPQILQNPGISQLQRTLQNAGGSAIAEKEAAQNASRLATLNRVSPVTGTVQQSAENFGNALAPQVIAADAAARQRVSAAFNAVDPQEQARLLLPLDQMQAARDQFLGRATFGNGGRADQALATAQRIGTEAAPAEAAVVPAFTSGGAPLSAADRQAVAAALGGARPAAATATRPAPIPFREVQDLRSSISEAAEQARLAGSNREAAALTSMLQSIDESVQRAAGGGATAVENFPPEMARAWQVARDLHAERMATFRTGPQASIFRQGGDGLPQAQGAELAGKFFSPRMSQSSDIASFNRIATQETQAALKNYAVTDAANQTDRLGNLTNAKFNNWLKARSGAVDGLMTEGERAQLRGVASDLSRADQAAVLNMAKGSPTVQNALSLGPLDNKLVEAIVKRTPFVGRFTGPMLEALQNTARAGKVAQIGGLLAEPAAFDTALAQYLSQSIRAPIGILDPGWLGLARTAPAIAASGSGRP